ncbi:sugar phosphate isomerase/epimerase [Pseudarthrobacter sp. NamE5]|uniref:sugar phosphate isomerase/epimerase family protein n=1 Tax=Pseudarthrobacter sp. NamE5 TaxID=2576839 RepID=UPI001F0F6E98|nr:sugar phosphate isomerase/epimerase [Pseudarthrobacter sp. NamE5]
MGLNWDPSHMMWQGIDPVSFIWDFKDRIYVDCKDTKIRQTGRNTVLTPTWSGHPPGAAGTSFPQRGDVPWEAFFRALAAIGYEGPISIEWEDAEMDRPHGAPGSPRRPRKNMTPPPPASASTPHSNTTERTSWAVSLKLIARS